MYVRGVGLGRGLMLKGRKARGRVMLQEIKADDKIGITEPEPMCQDCSKGEALQPFDGDFCRIILREGRDGL
jgi:hypothetical protein